MVQVKLYLGQFFGCDFPFSICSIMERMFFVKIKSEKHKKQCAYACCQESNKMWAASSLKSVIKGKIGQLWYILVINQVCWFINFYKSF